MRTILTGAVLFIAGLAAASLLFLSAPPSVPVVAAEEAVSVRSAEVSVEIEAPASEAEDQRDYAYRGVALDTLRRVKARMRDPDSVQFRNLVVIHVSGGSDTPESSAVCGEVNSRNGFGAYVGFMPFVAADEFLLTVT